LHSDYSYSYKIHDFCNISSDYLLPDLSFFNEAFSDSDICNIHLSRGLLDNYNLDNFKKVGDSFFYNAHDDEFISKLNWMGFKWNFLVKGLLQKNPISLVLDQGFLEKFWLRPPFMKVNILLRIFIHLQLLSKHLTFIHSASIVKNENCIIIPAFSNTGKTSTCLDFVTKRNGLIMSDDTVIVNDSGYCFAYPSPLSISLATYRSFSNFLSSSSINGSKLYLMDLFSKIIPPPLTNNQISLPLENLIDNYSIPKKSRINAICMIQDGEGKVEELDPYVAAKKILSLARSEFFWRTHPIIQSYSYCNPSFDIASIETREDDIINSLVSNIDKIYLLSGKPDQFPVLIDKIFNTL